MPVAKNILDSAHFRTEIRSETKNFLKKSLFCLNISERISGQIFRLQGKYFSPEINIFSVWLVIEGFVG